MLLSLALRLLFQQFAFGRVPKCQGEWRMCGNWGQYEPKVLDKQTKEKNTEKNFAYESSRSPTSNNWPGVRGSVLGETQTLLITLIMGLLLFWTRAVDLPKEVSLRQWGVVHWDFRTPMTARCQAEEITASSGVLFYKTVTKMAT